MSHPIPCICVLFLSYDHDTHFDLLFPRFPHRNCPLSHLILSHFFRILSSLQMAFAHLYAARVKGDRRGGAPSPEDFGSGKFTRFFLHFSPLLHSSPSLDNNGNSERIGTHRITACRWTSSLHSPHHHYPRSSTTNPSRQQLELRRRQR